MGGEGSMMAANQSLKSNRALKRQSTRGKFSFVSANAEKWVDHKKASPELLEEIRQKMKLQQQRNKRRLLIAWIVVLGILVGGILLITKN